MKKALIIANTAGFIITFLQKDIKILQSMGFEVDCAGDASYKDREENDKTFRDFGCKFYQIDMDARNPASRANLKGFEQIRTLIKAEKYDFVHCHTPVAGALTRLAAIPVRMGGGIRVVYTTHGFAFHKYSSRKSWWMWYLIEKIMSLFCDAIITMNSEDYGNAKRMFAKNVYRINGVGLNTNRFTGCLVDRESYRQKLGIGKDEFMILAVGELSERKNHQVVVRALGKMENTNAVFAICGKAMQGVGTHDKLQSLADEYGIRLVFLGHRSDIPEVCHCADIGVIPSVREGLAIAGLEMLASGIPVIGSDVKGIRDYIQDGVNGYLVTPFDVDGFSHAICKLMDADNRKALSENCLNSIAEFDSSVSYAQMERIYVEMLRNSKD